MCFYRTLCLSDFARILLKTVLTCLPTHLGDSTQWGFNFSKQYGQKQKKKDCKLYHNSLSCQSLSYYLHGFLCRVVWACACLVAQSCPILRDNLHCSPPSPLSTVFSRLEWKISSSREATGVTNKVFHVFFQLMVMVVNEVVNFMSACLDHGVLIFDQTLYWMFLWGCILGNINI